MGMLTWRTLTEQLCAAQVLVFIVELLSGKAIPNKVKSFATNKAKAAEQLVQHYAAVLQHLEQHGALMNCVLPEHLLDEASLDLVLDMRESRAASDAEAASCELWCAQCLAAQCSKLVCRMLACWTFAHLQCNAQRTSRCTQITGKPPLQA
jgi:hypothetical protein